MSIIDVLINLFRRKRSVLKSQFDRVLPTNELFNDRWEKASYLGFGKKSSIYDSSLVFGKVKVGNNTWIGPFTILDGTGDLEIGNNCTISAGVQIYTHDNIENTLSSGKEPFRYGSVVIGDNCYLAPNVIISRGVTLGKGTIVAANSFVNKSFPESSKIGGSPAKPLSIN